MQFPSIMGMYEKEENTDYFIYHQDNAGWPTRSRLAPTISAPGPNGYEPRFHEQVGLLSCYLLCPCSCLAYTSTIGKRHREIWTPI